MAKVVIENRLRRRALRAQVAFAARCARRVQPLTNRRFADRHKHEAVERAIALAEQFAGGISVKPHAGRAADAAREVARAAWTAQDITASRAADAATYAAQAAGAHTAAGRVAEAAFYAYSDAAAAANAAGARDAFFAASVRDLAKLARLKLGAFPELGAPIDPSESGALGPLWPEGQPEW
jgi:hypothetical protein